MIKKQNFGIVLNTFFDAGRCIDTYSFSKAGIPSTVNQNDYFSSSEGVHSAIGGGLHFVMNDNFIVTTEYGVALNKADGPGGLYITLNFLF